MIARHVATTLAVALVAAGPTIVAAAELTKEVCEALRAEKARLEAAGVAQAMEKGPEWAKANLGADRMRQIQRYIEVGEGLAFRCERPRPQDAKPDEEDTTATLPATPAAAAKSKTAPAGAAPRKPAPPPADQVAAQPKAAPKSPDPSAEASQKAKPKPKPKANDAFVPPPPAKAPASGGLDGQAARQGGGATQ